MTEVRCRDKVWSILWNTQCKSCWAFNTAVTVRACKCSACLEMGPGRFQDVYPEIQGHQIALPFSFSLGTAIRDLRPESWPVFDETQPSTFKSLHSWNFQKSKNTGSCTITVSYFTSFRKRTQFQMRKDFDKLGLRELCFPLSRRGCDGIATYIPAVFFFFSVSPNGVWISIDWRLF